MMEKTAENDDLLLETLERLKAGDKKAMEALFERYNQRLYFYCYKTVKSKDLADDLVIEVFTKIWEKRSQIKLELSFDAFLITVTKNHILKYLRKVARETRLKEQLLNASEYYYDSEQSEDVYQEYLTLTEQVVEEMPVQRQKVFKLRWQEGLSYEEIGDRLGLSKNTVKEHLSQAKKQLRKRFNSHPDATFVFVACSLLEIFS